MSDVYDVPPMGVSSINTPRSSSVAPVDQQRQSTYADTPEQLSTEIWGLLKEPLPHHSGGMPQIAAQSQHEGVQEEQFRQPLHVLAGLSPGFEPHHAPNLREKRQLQQRMTSLAHKAELISVQLADSRDAFSRALELLRGGSLEVKDLLAQPELLRVDPAAERALGRDSESTQ